MILKYPLRTEKSIRMLEMNNVISFVVDARANKSEIKEEVQKEFNVKVDEVNTILKSNKKIAYVKLKKENLAVDIATKLGLM